MELTVGTHAGTHQDHVLFFSQVALTLAALDQEMQSALFKLAGKDIKDNMKWWIIKPIVM